MDSDRGPYLTPNRYLELEREIARVDGRLTERIDQLAVVLQTERRRNKTLRDILIRLVEDHPPKEP